MANRAYLFSTDDPDRWSPERANHSTPYMDSRHTIPLAWWFLFAPEEVRTVMDPPTIVGAMGVGPFTDIYVRTARTTAIDRWDRRRHLLEHLVRGKLDVRYLEYLRAVLEAWSGLYLVLDPGEVLGSIGRSTQADGKAFAEILATLAVAAPDIEAFVRRSSTYSSLDLRVISDIESAIVGCAYGALAQQAWDRVFGKR